MHIVSILFISSLLRKKVKSELLEVKSTYPDQLNFPKEIHGHFITIENQN